MKEYIFNVGFLNPWGTKPGNTIVFADDGTLDYIEFEDLKPKDPEPLNGNLPVIQIAYKPPLFRAYVNREGYPIEDAFAESRQASLATALRNVRDKWNAEYAEEYGLTIRYEDPYGDVDVDKMAEEDLLNAKRGLR